MKLLDANPLPVPPLTAKGSAWQRTWYDTPLVSVMILRSSVGQEAGKPEGVAVAGRVAVDDAVVEETCEVSAGVFLLASSPLL